MYNPSTFLIENDTHHHLQHYNDSYCYLQWIFTTITMDYGDTKTPLLGSVDPDTTVFV